MKLLACNNSIAQRQTKCRSGGYLEVRTLAYGDAAVDIWYGVGCFQFRKNRHLVYI